MLPTYHDLDPSTPVLVGVGESSDPIDAPDYAALSEAALAAEALRAAAADTGVDPATVLAALDVAAMTRSFDAMGVGSPFGTPASMPWAALRRVGAAPGRVVYETLGGQTPQSLLTEICRDVAEGRHEVGVVLGADVTSTTRHLTRGAGRDLPRPDFSDDADGPVEDRGRGTHLVNTRHYVHHGLTNAPVQYGVLENARRHRLGRTREEHGRAMAALLAPMSRVAATNPHSAAPLARTAEEIADEHPDNRRVADPYLRLMVARDQVNQGAAAVVMSVAAARRLGVDPARWVFLAGHASLVEQPLLERADLGGAPASVAAVQHALDVAGVGVDDLAHLDLYSCFPVAVSVVADGLCLDADDPRGLTVTGGLPYFGGAGSNYSLHAVAAVARRLRERPEDHALVGANGGVMSKYAAGVWTGRPTPWRPDDSAALQHALDAAPRAAWTEVAEGSATVESWSVEHRRDGGRSAVLVCRDLAGRRFLATACAGDEALLDRLDGSDGTDDATGTRVHARHVDHAGAVNTVALTRAALDAAHPLRRARWDRDWQRLEVSAERGSLTVRAAGRTGARWDRLVTQELDEVVDAYLADPHLRVLVLRGGADFCAGLDLDEVGWGHTRVAGRHGFVGLTARDDLDKPVVAAVTGAAHDEGLEVLLACHVVLAADDADLALTQPSRGLLAEHGGPERLLRALGPATAYDLALTGRHVDAHEALRLGLVSRVAPGADLDDVLAEVVSQVLAQSPTSLRATLLAARGDATGIDEVTFSEDLLRATTARQQGTDPEWSGV